MIPVRATFEVADWKATLVVEPEDRGHGSGGYTIRVPRP